MYCVQWICFVYQKSLKRLFKTSFWVQNNLLNLCSRAVNSQRLFGIIKKLGWNVRIKSFCKLNILYLSWSFCFLTKLSRFQISESNRLMLVQLLLFLLVKIYEILNKNNNKNHSNIIGKKYAESIAIYFYIKTVFFLMDSK